MRIELKAGEKYSETVSFSKEQVKQFCIISGDNNPVHIDEDYAAKTPFKKCIVPGLLASSVFSKLIANDFPGPGSVYLEQTILFKNPVYPGENCTATITLVDQRTSSKGQLIYKINLLLTDMQGEILLEGNATVLN